MRIKFVFDAEVNRECWERLIAAKQLFGKTFPNEMSVTADDEKLAIKAVRIFQDWWDAEDDPSKGLETIYQHAPPEEMVCYINTSGYSMDIHARRAISLSMKRDTPQKVRTTVIHELSHFMFREYFASFCESIGCTPTENEEIKEVLTVINNVVFTSVDDTGYKVHAVLRERALEIWNATQNIDNVIRETKAGLSTNIPDNAIAGL